MAQSQLVTKGAEPASTDPVHGEKYWALVIGSIGVVYGDIGTSPLYAFKEAIHAAKATSFAGREAVFGVLSLITWALLLIVTLKYVFILLRADNRGEGGIFALMALSQSVAKRSAPVIMGLGIAGAAFFYGDAVITPAISVLSAVEGLHLVSPAFDHWVLPLTVVILIGLFIVQSRGTAQVAAFFGPITVVWFIALFIGGFIHVVANPDVLVALNPLYGVKFILKHGVVGLTVLGLVFLAVTGAEALYADLGHFGRKPIQTAWLYFVLPALMMNYFGQGALVLSNPAALSSPFYLLYPEWALVPMVILATAATIIASQAVITGAFSLTRQAIQLGLLPRLGITHTSESMAGQIYMPRVNWLLLIAVLFMVLLFKNSSALAAAYGVAVTAEMVITSLIAFFLIWRLWGWSVWQTALLIVPLLFIEQAFFAANMLKIFEGAWVPLLMAACVGLVMVTWVRGARLLAKQTRKNEADLDWLLRKLEAKPPHRVPGTAVFFTADPTAAPTALMHNLKHNRILHERNIILSIKTEDIPRVPRYERVTVDRVTDTFIRVVARYGFMETPSVPKILDVCRRKDLNIDMSATSFFLSRRNLKPTPKSEMPAWQDRLFVALARSAQDATTYFQIPTDRVVEVGTQVAV
ncbi:potassium transporter Kup [Hyphomicrobium sp. xq]|uniref:Probable potassium transport system protein Kup n=1 Tax=Hyphomicrobium album TaxID=2665159 RepID=A0A6I3KJY2_9HYPH|nr:potassium transporter Kup [Hyphomicrobium album]